MTYWHCASTLFMLSDWELQPKFPCCWFKIRPGIFTDGISGSVGLQTYACCLCRFFAVFSDWHFKTKTISFFGTLSMKPSWRRSDTVINSLMESAGEENKKTLCWTPTINRSHTSCSLRSVAHCPPSFPLYLLLPIIRFVNILYCRVCSHVDRLS